MMKKTIFSVILASLALSASAQFGRNPDTNPDKGYKDTYQGYFTVGVAVNMRNINDPQTVENYQEELQQCDGRERHEAYLCSPKRR